MNRLDAETRWSLLRDMVFVRRFEEPPEEGVETMLRHLYAEEVGS